VQVSSSGHTKGGVPKLLFQERAASPAVRDVIRSTTSIVLCIREKNMASASFFARIAVEGGRRTLEQEPKFLGGGGV